MKIGCFQGESESRFSVCFHPNHDQNILFSKPSEPEIQVERAGFDADEQAAQFWMFSSAAVPLFEAA